jgi:AraC-like DNA-binding protein
MNLVPRLLQLAAEDTRHLTQEARHSCISAFVARRTESVQAISVPAANLLIVLEGTKKIWRAGRAFTYLPGAAFALPPGAVIDVVNEPDPRSGMYRALFLGFRPDLLAQARQRWRSLAGGAGPADPTVVISEGLASAVLHTGEALSGRVKVSERVKEQRTLEVLLLLAEAGAAPLRPDLKSCSTAEAVRSLVRDDPASNWTAAVIAATLGKSEATLRRNLRQDGTQFREIVADERMRLAHTILAEGRSVAEAAGVAGYASLSHFAKRFFAKYGRLPSHRLAH